MLRPPTQPVILTILIIAFFLRLYQLDAQALRGDEAATVLYSALPISQLWEHARVTDPHPPLYYLMLHPWQWLLGETAWVMRFAGVVASTLAVAGLYGLAQLTLRRRGLSLFAAALMAANPLQIWLAQDVRSYPFFTLLGLLSAWALWQALPGSSQKSVGSSQKSVASSQKSVASSQHKDVTSIGALHITYYALRITHHSSRFTPWFIYIFFTIACFYIHYYTVFLILFQGIFALLNTKKFWPQRWPWLASQLAIGLLMMPGLYLAYNFIGQAAGGIEIIPTPDILRLVFSALLTGFTLTDAWGLWVSLLLAPIWIFGLIVLLRRDFTSGVFWTLFFAAPVVGVIALSIDRPFFKERFLIQAQPAFELLLAVGFITLWRVSAHGRWQVAGGKYHVSRITYHVLPFTFYATRFFTVCLLVLLLTANALALSNYFANPTYAKSPPWYLYHNHVRDKAKPNDVMLTNFPEASVSYYSPNGLPFYVVPAERDRSVEFRLEETQKIANAYQRVWFLPLLQQGFDEQGDVLNWLDRHADRVNQIFFPAYHLNLYLSPSAIEANMVRQPLKFTHGLHLRGFQILDAQGASRLTANAGTGYTLTLKPEDELTLSLYWLADGPTDTPYTVFTHLIAADGFNRAGQDNQPVWGSYPTTHWSAGEKITDKYTLTIPPGTPPGDYSLRIGWYNSNTLERVPTVDETGQPLADHVILNVVIQVTQPQG
jgi:hypothetical protein